ncbi:MAG: DUF447 family protein [Planctomycetes bacterium]|nr:DUF447 family protein [Planctomycetota bacterium]
MILEGLVTTLNTDDTINVAPMGATVGSDMKALVLRPYRTSQTYRNLKERPEGVFHVTDDVLLLARAAIHALDETPETFEAAEVRGRVLTDACRWYEFRVEWWDERQEPPRAKAEVVHSGRLRDFFGLNRAKHAVVEAAILASRVEFLPKTQILAELDRLEEPVQKTGGPEEQKAFDLLRRFVAES